MIDFWRVAPRYRVGDEREGARRERVRMEREAMKAAGYRTEYLFNYRSESHRNRAKAQAVAMAKRIEAKTGIKMELMNVELKKENVPSWWMGCRCSTGRERLKPSRKSAAYRRLWNSRQWSMR